MVKKKVTYRLEEEAISAIAMIQADHEEKTGVRISQAQAIEMALFGYRVGFNGRSIGTQDYDFQR